MPDPRDPHRAEREAERDRRYHDAMRGLGDAYTDAKHVDCVVCHAPAGQPCVNPVTGQPRKAPCIGRTVQQPGGAA